MLPVIEWHPTDKGNVEVTNSTSDFYRFFDATPHAEFLYACVQQTIEVDLPEEADYLRCHDTAVLNIMNLVEMPDRTAASFVMFVRQNGGTLSTKRRKREFAALTDVEVEKLENIVNEAFNG